MGTGETVFRVFVLTDVAGSTALWRDYPEEMASALNRHDEIVAQVVSSHGGDLIRTKGEGDSTFSVFKTVRDAVLAVTALMRELGIERWPTHTPIQVRASIHAGEAEHRNGDYYGTTVNKTARLRAMAHPGQIVVSSAVVDLSSQARKPVCEWKSLGMHRPRDFDALELFQPIAPGIESEFPPLVNAVETPHNLPQPAGRFFNRETEMNWIREKLASGRLVSVVGPGGCGKSRLLLELGWRELEEYMDGVFRIELAGITDPALVVQEIARPIGVRESLGRPLEVALTEALHERQLLLILDNVEHLLDEVGRIAKKLLDDTDHLRIATTSQRRLGTKWETVLTLNPLEVPSIDALDEARIVAASSTKLFIDRALAVGMKPPHDDELLRVAEICRQLDGMPLAIELAASRAVALGTRDILERIQEQIDAAPLQAALDWAYGQLDPLEAKLFRRLAVFASPFDLEAAERVGADTEADAADLIASVAVVDLLQELVERSLLQVRRSDDGVNRYSMLVPIRTFARTRLAASGELDACRNRHAALFLRRLDQIADDAAHMYTPEHSAWFVAEQPDVRAALDFAFQTAELRSAGVRACTQLEPFWRHSTEFAEGLRRLEQAEASAESLLAKAKCQSARGVLLHKFGLLDQAKAALRSAAETFESEGDRQSHGLAVGALGLVHWMQGDYDEARTAFERSRDIAIELGDQDALGNALNNLGILAWEINRLDEAAKFLNEARLVRKKAGNDMRAAESLLNLGLVYTKLGRFDEARKVQLHAAELFRKAGSRINEIFALYNLADVDRRQGRFDEALASLDQVQAYATRSNDRYVLANALLLRGLIDQDRGAHGDAIRACLAALEESAPEGYAQVILESCEGLAKSFAAREQWHEAALALGAWLVRVHAGVDEALAVSRRTEPGPTLLAQLGDRFESVVREGAESSALMLSTSFEIAAL